MLALRFAGVVALTLWVGGLLALGAIVAPSTFDILAARHVADNRVLAGAVFGEALRRFHLLSYACAFILLTTLLIRGVLGPRPVMFAARLAIVLVMLGASAYVHFVVSARIASVQAQIGAAPSSLPEGDPRRESFGRLHATATGLELVPILGGLLLLFRELKD
jgi:uncharacterized membrane protein